MKSVQLSELREHLDEYIEAAKNGETVSVVEGQKPVIEMKPAPRKLSDEEWIERLVAKGVVKKGPTAGQPLPEDFYTRPLPKPKASVLEQLLEDRHSGD